MERFLFPFDVVQSDYGIAFDCLPTIVAIVVIICRELVNLLRVFLVLRCLASSAEGLFEGRVATSENEVKY